MGQKTRPTGFRVGIVEDWRSRVVRAEEGVRRPARRRQARFADFIAEEYNSAAIAKVEIERTRDSGGRSMLHSARPGIIIGRKGQEIDRLKADWKTSPAGGWKLRFMRSTTRSACAALVAEDIAQQLPKRGSFRRAIKRTLEQVMEAGVFGVKAELSGRLGGAEMSRQEKAMQGFDSAVDAAAAYRLRIRGSQRRPGVIGIKVWIDLGNYADEEIWRWH